MVCFGEHIIIFHVIHFIPSQSVIAKILGELETDYLLFFIQRIFLRSRVFLTPRLKLVVSVAILLSLVWLTPPIRHWILSSIQSLSASMIFYVIITV
jgi:hypothetical protein